MEPVIDKLINVISGLIGRIGPDHYLSSGQREGIRHDLIKARKMAETVRAIYCEGAEPEEQEGYATEGTGGVEGDRSPPPPDSVEAEINAAILAHKDDGFVTGFTVGSW